MDPSGGGLGQAAGEMLKEMQDAQKSIEQKPDVTKSDGANFKQAMNAQQTTAVQDTQKVGQVQKASNVLKQARINANMPSTRVGATQKSKKVQALKLLQGLVRGQDRMDDMMKMALSGKQLNLSDLLGIQAGVYRFSQELELTSKVVEKASSGIKQTMNTQV